MSNSLKTLISKLNEPSRKALERAANLCMARGNYEVDLEHFLVALIEAANGDFAVLCRRFGIPIAELERDLEREIGDFKTGNTRTPVLSSHLPVLLEQGWLIASLDSRAGRIRGAHLLLALLTEAGLRQLAERASKLFGKVGVHELKHKMDELTEGSMEAADRVALSEPASDGDSGASFTPVPGKTPALDQFTSNLTQRARDGKIDPVIGRDPEIRQCVDILMRRRQNNPILTGEAGVGKTAVVEGLALRIAAGDVPDSLLSVELHTLDMGLLQAGASVKGEFENRLKNVIDEVKKSLHPIVLFIDEAHTMIGAGGQAGQNDAANLLKPALARGELRTVAATTWSEYKKYFEKDAALARRFQVVKVEEPTEELATAMLRGMVPLMERHFNIRLLEEAVVEAVRLSARYVSGRQLPDKAVSVLDTACAKVALSQNATPAVIEDKRRVLERIAAEREALQREISVGADHGPRIAELESEHAEVFAQVDALERQWEQEKKLVLEIRTLRNSLETKPASSHVGAVLNSTANDRSSGDQPTPEPDERSRLQSCMAELDALQAGVPLVPMHVNGSVVAEVVSAWTGVPLGRMVKDEIKSVLELLPALRERVVGQDHALEAIAQRVRTSRANLEDPDKPKGVFLFVGPSGVGKTETALALAEILFGGERNMVTVNMSEYQEAHSVSGLKGSPPGYVGYGEGGVLTEAVRRRPYSVVLLDEVEKAHPDVLELFFQVFDKGTMDDAEGREIDFRNTLIIMTSNVGSQAIMQACLNRSPDELPSVDALTEQLRPQLYKSFKAAFLGRLKVVPYYPISDDVLEQIIRLKLNRIAARAARNHKARFEYDRGLVNAVLARCTEVDSGARAVDHILNGTLLPEIAESVLARMAAGEAVAQIKVRAGKDGRFKYAVK